MILYDVTALCVPRYRACHPLCFISHKQMDTLDHFDAFRSSQSDNPAHTNQLANIKPGERQAFKLPQKST